MRWPWQRREPETTLDHGAPSSDAASAPASPMGWAFLPPLQRQIGDMPLVTRAHRFSSELPAWRNPSFTGTLTHRVSAHAPSGVIDSDGGGTTEPQVRSATPDLTLLAPEPVRPSVQRAAVAAPAGVPSWPAGQASLTTAGSAGLPVLAVESYDLPPEVAYDVDPDGSGYAAPDMPSDGPTGAAATDGPAGSAGSAGSAGRDGPPPAAVPPPVERTVAGGSSSGAAAMPLRTPAPRTAGAPPADSSGTDGPPAHAPVQGSFGGDSAPADGSRPETGDRRRLGLGAPLPTMPPSSDAPPVQRSKDASLPLVGGEGAAGFVEVVIPARPSATTRPVVHDADAPTLADAARAAEPGADVSGGPGDTSPESPPMPVTPVQRAAAEAGPGAGSGAGTGPATGPAAGVGDGAGVGPVDGPGVAHEEPGPGLGAAGGQADGTAVGAAGAVEAYGRSADHQGGADEGTTAPQGSTQATTTSVQRAVEGATAPLLSGPRSPLAPGTDGTHPDRVAAGDDLGTDRPLVAQRSTDDRLGPGAAGASRAGAAPATPGGDPASGPTGAPALPRSAPSTAGPGQLDLTLQRSRVSEVAAAATNTTVAGPVFEEADGAPTARPGGLPASGDAGASPADAAAATVAIGAGEESSQHETTILGTGSGPAGGGPGHADAEAPAGSTLTLAPVRPTLGSTAPVTALATTVHRETAGSRGEPQPVQRWSFPATPRLPSPQVPAGMPSVPSRWLPGRVPGLPPTAPMPTTPRLPAAGVPGMPSLPDAASALPGMPGLPTAPGLPDLPTTAAPTVPGLPTMPAVPTMPTMPTADALPGVPGPSMPLAAASSPATATAAGPSEAAPETPAEASPASAVPTEQPGADEASAAAGAADGAAAPAGGAAGGRGAEASSPEQVEALAQRLFAPLMRRIRAEMLLDRERRGLRTDSW